MREKKQSPIFASTLAVILLFICAAEGRAQPHSEHVVSQAYIKPIFGMTVTPGSLDFSSVDPGTTTEERQLTVRCYSNNNRPWSIQLSDTAELTSGTFTIPNDNFHWWGQTSGSGTWHAGTGSLSITPFTFYECGFDEYIVYGLVINLSFNVVVPVNQAAGIYTTTLILTMTE